MPIPAAIYAGGSVLGGLVSSIFGKKSNDSANATNLKIAQMNNEWSERMMDKQNNYNIAQWQREAQFAEKQAQSANAFTEYMQDKANEYNSAKNQAARLREAGINPAIAMTGANAGTAQGASGAQASTPSGNSVGLPSPTSTRVQPFDYSGVANIVENAALLASSLSKQAAETDFIKAQKDTMLAETKARLAKFAEETRGLKYDTDFRKATESLNVSNLNEEYLSRVNNRLIQEEQKVLMKQTQALNRIQMTYLPDQMKADIALKLATAEYQGTTDLAKDLKFFEKKYGRKLSKQELQVIFDAWKQNIIYAPTRGMSATGAAATIGNVVGNWIRR